MRQSARKAATQSSFPVTARAPKSSGLPLLLLTVLLLLPGCTKKEISYPTEIPDSPVISMAQETAPQSPERKTPAAKDTTPPLASAKTPGDADINGALIIFYTKWRRTPYRLGGLSHKGIDCSGFTYLFFKDNYNIILPRTVSGQVKIGKKIPRKKLQPGDLVFFKTGFFQRHVGICMDNQRFAHASSTYGVMVSRLDNSYWKRKYWKARRPF